MQLHNLEQRLVRINSELLTMKDRLEVYSHAPAMKEWPEDGYMQISLRELTKASKSVMDAAFFMKKIRKVKSERTLERKPKRVRRRGI